MKYLLSLHRQIKHTFSHIDTFEPSSCEIARLFFVVLSAKKTSSEAGYVVGETLLNCATDEENFSNNKL